MSEATTDPIAAVRDVEDTIRPVLRRQLHEAVESDAEIAAGLREWRSGAGDGPFPTDAEADTDAVDAAVRRAAAREATVRISLACFRGIVGSEPPAGLRSTPVAPFRMVDDHPAVDARLGDLATVLAEHDAVGPAVLGMDYADTLEADERRVRGQFYTPPAVAKLVTRWALPTPGEWGRTPPRLLDPAAGTGAFPLAALEVCGEHGPVGRSDDRGRFPRMIGVDVDGVALYLAALRLSAHFDGGAVEGFDRRTCSVFALEPSPDPSHRDEIGLVDAVVGNPPFVRAGDLDPRREHFRDHLSAFGPAGETPYVSGERALSRRCDASVYFVTHATRFLRPGGRLGMVLPAKWLESDYGRGFRRFLADQYRVRAVVGFDRRHFDALVDTVLLLAERKGPQADHGGGPVRFVRLEERADAVDSLGAIFRDGGDGPTRRRAGRARVVRRPQSAFAEARQCSPYLRAPGELLPLLDHDGFVPLGELAAVLRGVTTGANDFFLLDRRDRERWAIDRRFLRPALRSVRGVDARTLALDDVELSILDVHGFLSTRLDAPQSETDELSARAKETLLDAGYDALVAYVEHAESEGVHEGRTCQARRIWFDLGELPTPDAFVPKLVRERVFTVRNLARAVPSNAIDCLSVEDGIDPDLLLGVLDSSLCRALMELWGRDEAGLLQLMTYETRSLPVPDVRTFSAGEAKAVREAAATLDADPDGPDADGQAALDAALHDALDLDVTPSRLRQLRTRLLRRRVAGGDRIDGQRT